MASRNTKRIYGRTGHPAIDATPLALAFLVGVGGNVAFKFMPVHPVAGAIFAGVVLICYALYAYIATELRLDAETIGDNCYYLGFLFTLTSLAVTLYFVVEAPSATRADMIPEIIAGFGVALSSTIFGVFLRVLMMQFKIDVESRERHERVELNEASRRFRAELAVSLDQMKAFSVESLQQGAEREGRMRDAFDKLLAGMQQELLQSAAQFGPALSESVRLQTEAALGAVNAAARDASAQAVRSIQVAMLEITDTAKSAATRNGETADTVRNGIMALKETVGTLTQGAQDILESVGRTQSATTQMTEVFSREVSEGTDSMTRAMKNARQRLETGTQSFSDVATRASVVLQDGASRIQRSFDATASKVEEAGDRLTLRIDQIGATPVDRPPQQPPSNGNGLTTVATPDIQGPSAAGPVAVKPVAISPQPNATPKPAHGSQGEGGSSWWKR